MIDLVSTFDFSLSFFMTLLLKTFMLQLDVLIAACYLLLSQD